MLALKSQCVVVYEMSRNYQNPLQKAMEKSDFKILVKKKHVLCRYNGTLTRCECHGFDAILAGGDVLDHVASGLLADHLVSLQADASVESHEVQGQTFVRHPTSEALVEFGDETDSDLADRIVDEAGQGVVVLDRVLVADTFLLADLEHGAAGRQPQPGFLRRPRLALLQEVAVGLDHGGEHVERLLGGDLVILQPDQPSRHHLHALDLALGLERQIVEILPLLAVIDPGLGLVLHDELLDDVARDAVLDLDGELVGEVVGDVPEGDHGRPEGLAPGGQALVEVGGHDVEDVGEHALLARRCINVQALDRVLGLLRGPASDEGLANGDQVLQDFWELFTKRLLLADHAQDVQDEGGDVLDVVANQDEKLFEDVLVKEVSGVHGGEDEEQPQPALPNQGGVDAELVGDRATVQGLLDQLQQVLDGLAVDHDVGDSLEELLHRVVIQVGHHGRSQLFENDSLESRKTCETGQNYFRKEIFLQLARCNPCTKCPRR